MSKRAIFPILTSAYFVGEAVAKLGFVFILMIQTFNPIMCSFTPIMFGTFLGFCEFAKFRCVEVIISALVFNAVEVEARFVVMRTPSLWTFVSFKFMQE